MHNWPMRDGLRRRDTSRNQSLLRLSSSPVILSWIGSTQRTVPDSHLAQRKWQILLRVTKRNRHRQMKRPKFQDRRGRQKLGVLVPPKGEARVLNGDRAFHLA